MSILSYLVIDLVKTGLNRIHRRPRHRWCCYARSLARLFLMFFFFFLSFARVLSRVHLCPPSLPFLSHRPLRFFRLRGVYMRAIKCEQIEARVQDARKFAQYETFWVF